jgi:hypothetical protein
MSYREEEGQVVLTMSREQFDRLLMVFAMATMKGMQFRSDFPRAVENTMELLNQLNEGNPDYTPYQVAEVKQ